jgi:metal-responsive CopG/Arc/MetJ family transcriptional regulator
MHRTQIYFEQELFADIKQVAAREGVSLSAYIRKVLRENIDELDTKKIENKIDISAVAGMWQDSDITQESIRAEAWR